MLCQRCRAEGATYHVTERRAAGGFGEAHYCTTCFEALNGPLIRSVSTDAARACLTFARSQVGEDRLPDEALRKLEEEIGAFDERGSIPFDELRRIFAAGSRGSADGG